MEFCQFKWWMLYCNKVVLTGKTILVFMLNLLNLAEIIVLLIYCWSLSSVKRFTLFAVEGFTFFCFHLGLSYRKWAMLLFMPLWSYHTWVRSFIISTRTNTLVFVRSCLACRLHLYVIRLGRTQLGSGPWITFDSSLNQPLLTELTFDWKQLRTKFWLMINFRLNKRHLPLRMKRV